MRNTICIITLLMGIFFLFMTTWADAGRLGGGKNFGSRPSYSNNFSRPSMPGSSPSPSYSPQPTMGNRGLFGGFGGLFGGLLMGGLLGSLFFGTPFSGPSLMDILLIGGGIFLLLKLFRTRQTAYQPQASSGYGNTSWDHLRSTPPAPPGAANIPAGFDKAEFLEGAKAAYTHLQAAWDERNLEEIRHFTSDEVYQEIAAQAAADPNPGQTEIVLLEAKLLEVKSLGNQTVATVLFEALLREDRDASHPSQVREAWHFSRYETSGNTHWVVEGIQQMEQ